jgi:hypothetical protein
VPDVSNDLWMDGPDDILNAPLPKRRPKPRRNSAAAKKFDGTYARIPHDRGLRLAKRIGNPALAVLLVLEHVVHHAHTNRVTLTNGLLEQYGISPQSKIRGLRQLAAAEVISVGKRGQFESPIVTHHWYTPKGKLKGMRT